MSKVLRKKMVDELAEKFKGQKNLVLVDTKGLTARQATELRAELRESKVQMRAVKNSVALYTFRKLGVEGFDKSLTGMNAVIYGADPLAIAKRLVAYKEKNQRPEVRAAVIEGKPVSPAAIGDLAKLPGREEMLAQVLGLMNGVTAQFVSTLNEIPRKFVGTLQAVADKDKEKK